MKNFIKLALIYIFSFNCSWAAPVVFTFNETVGGSAPCFLNGTCPLMPGVAVGDPIFVSVTADNGQSGLQGQSWFQSDVTYAYATVGVYSGVFNLPYYTNDPIFSTDQSGNVISAWFADTDRGNPDSLGNSIELSSNAITSTMSNGNIQYWAFFARGQSNSNLHPEYWSVSQVPTNVPEPMSLVLVSIGIFALGLSSKKGCIFFGIQEIFSNSSRG